MEKIRINALSKKVKTLSSIINFLSTLFVSFIISSNVYCQSIYVKGYTKKNGVYVGPHHRSVPDGNKLNNWTAKGNINPYTGKKGYRNYNATTTKNIIYIYNNSGIGGDLQGIESQFITKGINKYTVPSVQTSQLFVGTLNSGEYINSKTIELGNPIIIAKQTQKNNSSKLKLYALGSSQLKHVNKKKIKFDYVYKKNSWIYGIIENSERLPEGEYEIIYYTSSEVVSGQLALVKSVEQEEYNIDINKHKDETEKQLFELSFNACIKNKNFDPFKTGCINLEIPNQYILHNYKKEYLFNKSKEECAKLKNTSLEGYCIVNMMNNNYLIRKLSNSKYFKQAHKYCSIEVDKRYYVDCLSMTIERMTNDLDNNKRRTIGVGDTIGNNVTDQSGYDAGYDWAESNGVTDELECYNESESFSEGCVDYLDDNESE